ncbi:hypothetical protein EMCRGX_G003114 [Ephydatia muelleri]
MYMLSLKMATAAAGCRFSLGITFSSEAEKDAFKLRVDSARRILFPYESTSQRPDNAALLNAMLDIVLSIQSTTPSTIQSTHSFLDTAGIYTGDEDKDDQRLCVVEHKAIRCLSGVLYDGGIVRIRFVCPHCKVARTWASSRVLAGHYLASQKLIHAFTCAGMLPSQFINFCKFAEIGVVSNKYIHSVYIHRQYQQIVADSAEESMNAAVQRVKANPEYVTSGEWVITDARHDSSANAYHSTVPCMAGSTRRIVGIATLSRPEHRVAQTREVACTKIVLPQVVARGLNVTEVAHDYQSTVKTYVEQLGMVNSYDTWHEMKICAGPVKARDKTWFAQLSDKARSTKVHLYWCMKNCASNPDILCNMIMNISQHFQGHHLNCHLESRCRQPGYLLTMREAIKAYEDAPLSTALLGHSVVVETPSGWSHLTTSY